MKLLDQVRHVARVQHYSFCLRMKDIDLERGQITVREGKGDKDRYVMLPTATREPILQRMEWRSALPEVDLEKAATRVRSPLDT